MSIFYDIKSKRAIKCLKETWGIDLDKHIRHWDARWYSNEPFVFILYKYKNGHMVRKEFYEFRNNQWQYVGYMSRKQCVDFYWKIKYEDCLRWYGRDTRNSADEKQNDKVMDIELDEYFKYYKQYVNRRKPEDDGAEVWLELPKEKTEEELREIEEADAIFKKILEDPDFFKN